MAKTALITGATAGIGYELAKCFARDGHDVILVARTEERLRAVAEELEQVFKIKAHAHPADLSQPIAPQQIFDALTAQNLRVDFLVNNAGFGTNGRFTETSLHTELEMIQVNVSALVALTKLFLPDMVTRKSGRVMNVASTAAFQPGPYMAIYCATKAFVLSFSEAIATELQGTGVTVTAVCPGATSTEFQARSGTEDIPLIKSKLSSVMKAEPVAQIGYKAMMRGERVCVTGLMNRVAAEAVRFAPRSLSASVAAKLMKR